MPLHPLETLRCRVWACARCSRKRGCRRQEDLAAAWVVTKAALRLLWGALLGRD